MGKDKTKYTSQYIDNISFNDPLQLKETLIYGTDGTNAIAADLKVPAAMKISVRGDNTYVAKAPVGTAVSASSWQAKKVAVSANGDTLITWADGNVLYDNAATDLTGLTYN